MKCLEDLPKDIYALFKSGKQFSEGSIQEFATQLARHISNRVTSESGSSTLRMSNLGTNCDRKLWYSIRTPELAEPLPPEAHMKFLFGDILEELILFLAKEAGHDVRDQQREVTLHGVKGHIDGVVDGVLVDVKSASSYSFKKFKDGITRSTDAFGYLTQLGGYREALRDTDGVQEGDGVQGEVRGRKSDSERAAFIAVDKQLGHICVDVHDKDLDQDYERLIERKRAVLDSNKPPDRSFDAIPDGKSGNYKLGVECSYCPFKRSCWSGLRTFIYSDGPRHLVRVAREPNVPEAK